MTELLTVLAIISLIGGLSAGAFQLSRSHYALAATASHLEGILRAGRNAAITSGVPSRVVIDPRAGEAVTYGFETLGEWGFEDSVDGVSYGMRKAPASLIGGASIGRGHAGNGLRLSGGGYADCGTASIYDLRSGVFAEAWILWHPPPEVDERTTTVGSPRRTPPVSGSFRASLRKGLQGSRDNSTGTAPLRSEGDARGILSKGEAYFLGILWDGSLEGRIGAYSIRTAPGTVLAGRWTRVALWFDGERLLLLADGIERESYVVSVSSPLGPPKGTVAGRTVAGRTVAGRTVAGRTVAGRTVAGRTMAGRTMKRESAVPESIPPSSAPFLIGSRSGNPGLAIDEVRLHGLVEPQRFKLKAPRERFLGWKKVIHFNRKGRLDPRYHETPIRILLLSRNEDLPTGKTMSEVPIDYSVTFENHCRRRGIIPPEGAEEAAENKILERISGGRHVVIQVDLSGALK